MDHIRYEIFDDVYDTPSSMDYHLHEKNNYYFTVFNYTKCYYNYYKDNGTYSKIKSELLREDINSVCKKELDELRKAVNDGLTYKEVNGQVRPIVTDYF
jgi:hypothetical protein